MDSTIQSIIEVALKQGIWAALYIYLFFRMLKQNEEREKEYQTIIDRLNEKIEAGIESIQEQISDVRQTLSNNTSKSGVDKL